MQSIKLLLTFFLSFNVQAQSDNAINPNSPKKLIIEKPVLNEQQVRELIDEALKKNKEETDSKEFEHTKEHDALDLIEQKKAANAAVENVNIAYAQLIISALGVAGLVYTLRLNSRAIKLTTQANDIARQHTKASVSISGDFELDRSEYDFNLSETKAGGLRALIKFDNIGQLQAKNTKFDAYIYNAKVTTKFFYDNTRIVIDSPRTFNKDAQYDIVLKIDYDDLKKAIKDGESIYLNARAEYDNGYGVIDVNEATWMFAIQEAEVPEWHTSETAERWEKQMQQIKLENWLESIKFKQVWSKIV